MNTLGMTFSKKAKVPINFLNTVHQKFMVYMDGCIKNNRKSTVFIKNFLGCTKTKPY